MNITDQIDNQLLRQPFTNTDGGKDVLEEQLNIACHYAKTENAIAVLSDMKTNKSYIYNGGLAVTLGLPTEDSYYEIDSIWEEEIFSCIHPDDLLEKYMLTLRYLDLLREVPRSERCNTYLISYMRMCNSRGEYFWCRHRLFYTADHANGSMQYFICVYSLSESTSDVERSVLFNSLTGSAIHFTKSATQCVLSTREKEILVLIGKGLSSKEIAAKLFISPYTVNRHRQNILEKLKVKNSTEACQQVQKTLLF